MDGIGGRGGGRAGFTHDRGAYHFVKMIYRCDILEACLGNRTLGSIGSRITVYIEWQIEIHRKLARDL